MTTAPRPPLRSAVIVLIATGFLLGCDAPVARGNADLEIRFSSAPSAEPEGGIDLVVLVSDLGWRPVNGAAVTLALTGPDGTEAATPRRLPGIGAGRYELRGVALEPAGRWGGTVRVDLTGGRWSEVDVEVLVGPAGGG